MSKMIQLRNVPDALHRTLKARAAMAGMSLSDYLLAEIREKRGAANTGGVAGAFASTQADCGQAQYCSPGARRARGSMMLWMLPPQWTGLLQTSPLALSRLLKTSFEWHENRPVLGKPL